MNKEAEDSVQATLKKHPFLTLSLAVLGLYIMSHFGGSHETECGHTDHGVGIETIKEVAEVKVTKEVVPVVAVVVKKVGEVAVKAAVVKADGEKLFASLGCAGCHGVAGKSVIPTFPVLAGKDADYLATQLLDFQSGKRPSPMMAGQAGKTKGHEQAIADYLAAQ